MRLTNDSYVVVLGSRSGRTERYYRDATGWLKESMRGRRFRMTAEQVLNHLLPAFAGVKPSVTVRVEHHPKGPSSKQISTKPGVRRREPRSRQVEARRTSAPASRGSPPSS